MYLKQRAPFCLIETGIREKKAFRKAVENIQITVNAKTSIYALTAFRINKVIEEIFAEHARFDK